MKTAIKIVLTISIFVVASYLAFFYEESYRKFIRWLYETISLHKISFFQPGKYFHFTSLCFIISTPTFIVLVVLSSVKLKCKQIMLNATLSLTLFIVFTLAYTYLNTLLKLAECTMCNNGKRILNYNDIAYDRIMITSLSLALLPWLISYLRHKKTNTISK